MFKLVPDCKKQFVSVRRTIVGPPKRQKAKPFDGLRGRSGLSRGLRQAAARRFCKIGHRGLYASDAMRHLGECERHLDASERADDGEVVGVAEMADAKDLAGELAEAGAERNVEIR